MKFEILKAKDGQFYFNLIARNHEIVATSEMYTRKENALKTAKLIAGQEDFKILDMTKELKEGSE